MTHPPTVEGNTSAHLESNRKVISNAVNALHPDHLNEISLDAAGKTIKRRTTNRTPYSKKRLEQVNAASRRSRQRQKDELQYLRTRVKELESELVDIKANHKTSDSTEPIDPASIAQEISQVHRAETVLSAASVEKDNDLAIDMSSWDVNGLMDILQDFDKGDNETMELSPVTSSNYFLSKSSEDILRCIQMIQCQADLNKDHVETQFLHAKEIQSRGYSLRTLLSTNSVSFYLSKFIPNMEPLSFQRILFSMMCRTNELRENIIGRELHIINENVVAIDARKVGSWTALAYGKSEIAMTIFVSRWQAGDDFMISINSVDFPELAKDSDCVQWNRHGWIRVHRHLEDGVEGILLTKHCTSGFVEDIGFFQKSGCFAEYMVTALCGHIEQSEMGLHAIAQEIAKETKNEKLRIIPEIECNPQLPCEPIKMPDYLLNVSH